ncbi:hypothetical protein BGX38DRAFT_608889 [Terfezia claveryi]|nr:hypothetical protein BGX38DRAFT_608889 [Terfezia claveryi]
MEAKKGRMRETKYKVVKTTNTTVGHILPPPPPSQPKPQPTTTHATAPPSKTATSVTRPKPSPSSSSSTVDQRELNLSISTLTTQCTSILEGLDEQVQINQALVSDVEKLREENREFRTEIAETKKRLEKIEGIVINILRGGRIRSSRWRWRLMTRLRKRARIKMLWRGWRR